MLLLACLSWTRTCIQKNPMCLITFHSASVWYDGQDTSEKKVFHIPPIMYNSLSLSWPCHDERIKSRCVTLWAHSFVVFLYASGAWVPRFPLSFNVGHSNASSSNFLPWINKASKWNMSTFGLHDNESQIDQTKGHYRHRRVCLMELLKESRVKAFLI